MTNPIRSTPARESAASSAPSRPEGHPEDVLPRTALTSMFPLVLDAGTFDGPGAMPPAVDRPVARPLPGTPRAAAVRSEAGAPGTVR
jgi:hypothetical protein